MERSGKNTTKKSLLRERPRRGRWRTGTQSTTLPESEETMRATPYPGYAAHSAAESLGSAALCDIAVLQSLSRRIHFGKFVAEAKLQSERRRFEGLIRRNDVKGIERAITDEAVEKKVLERLALKAMVYGRDPSSGSGRIDIVGMYKDWVIPLTKEVEAEYLLRRLDNEFE